MTRLTKSEPKPKPKDSILEFEAIGTRWSIELYGQTASPSAIQAVTSRIKEFDRAYSRFRGDSLVSRMSKKAGRYRLPKDAQPMMDLYKRLYDATSGAMTPLIGQTLTDAGYDADYSLREKPLRRLPTWDEAMEYDFPRLTLKRPVLLDFGAAGKGYLVDLVAAVLKSHGLKAFLVDAGGDMYHYGAEEVEVALEHPADASQAIGVVRLKNGSLCGSAGNRRVWGKYHHIINPLEGESPRHVRALWVCADTALLADALTTALFFAEPARLRQHFSFSYAMVHDDFSLKHSTDFPAEFFTEGA